MRKTVKKLFWAWDFDKEEEWLNEMAAKGLSLVSVGFCRYDFEETLPGEYGVRIELLENVVTDPESEKYIEFIESTGAEHVGTWLRWVYFRKKKTDGDFELFSDIDSKIKHLTRIMNFILVLAVANLLVGVGNTINGIVNIPEMVFLHVINILLGLWALWGYFKLSKKRKKLKSEQNIFE